MMHLQDVQHGVLLAYELNVLDVEYIIWLLEMNKTVIRISCAGNMGNLTCKVYVMTKQISSLYLQKIIFITWDIGSAHGNSNVQSLEIRWNWGLVHCAKTFSIPL